MSFEGQLLFRVFLASFLGAVVGLEREIKERNAGIQTCSLVSLGACLFTVVCLSFPRFFSEVLNSEGRVVVDISRVVQAVATGIGFIGAGAIFKSREEIEGLTTAAALWLVAGVGMAVGAGFYCLSGVATLFGLLILAGLGRVERIFFED